MKLLWIADYSGWCQWLSLLSSCVKQSCEEYISIPGTAWPIVAVITASGRTLTAIAGHNNVLGRCFWQNVQLWHQLTFAVHWQIACWTISSGSRHNYATSKIIQTGVTIIDKSAVQMFQTLKYTTLSLSPPLWGFRGRMGPQPRQGLS